MINDMLNDRDLRRRFSDDQSLSADEFANRHRHTVCNYYAGCGAYISLDVTRRVALKIWTHERSERRRTRSRHESRGRHTPPAKEDC